MNTEVRPLNFMPRDHSPLILNRPETRDKLRGMLHQITTDEVYRDEFIDARRSDESASANGLVYRLLAKDYFSELNDRSWRYISEASDDTTDLALSSEENRTLLKRPIVCDLIKALAVEGQEIGQTYYGLPPDALSKLKMMADEPDVTEPVTDPDILKSPEFKLYGYLAVAVLFVIFVFPDSVEPSPAGLSSQEIRAIARVTSSYIDAKIADAV